MFKNFKSILYINWIYFLLIVIIFWIGEVNLFSASGGSLDPWAKNQLIRFISFLPIFFLIIFLKPRLIFNFSEFLLFFTFLGLIATLIFGYTGMGAKDGLILDTLTYRYLNLQKFF